MIRKPSCLISRIQPGPAGGRLAGEGRQGSIARDHGAQCAHQQNHSAYLGTSRPRVEFRGRLEEQTQPDEKGRAKDRNSNLKGIKPGQWGMGHSRCPVPKREPPISCIVPLAARRGSLDLIVCIAAGSAALVLWFHNWLQRAAHLRLMRGR